jgi:hypothetical protein
VAVVGSAILWGGEFYDGWVNGLTGAGRVFV